jgi:hypothetical protein
VVVLSFHDGNVLSERLANAAPRNNHLTLQLLRQRRQEYRYEPVLAEWNSVPRMSPELRGEGANPPFSEGGTTPAFPDPVDLPAGHVACRLRGSWRCRGQVVRWLVGCRS